MKIYVLYLYIIAKEKLMKKDLISLSQLFTESIYRIPDYQRGYAWRNEQLEDFWDDLMNLQNDR